MEIIAPCALPCFPAWMCDNDVERDGWRALGIM